LKVGAGAETKSFGSTTLPVIKYELTVIKKIFVFGFNM
jgi:hypothetical protein